jgi:hypothetical protein
MNRHANSALKIAAPFHFRGRNPEAIALEIAALI